MLLGVPDESCLCIPQPITGGVVLLSLVWYAVGGRRHYKGPQSNRTDLKPEAASPDDALVAPPEYYEKGDGAQVV